jgi:integrase
MAKLTKRTVDAARPKQRDYVLWDEDLPRFGLRVRATGTKSYVVQYRAYGRTRHVTLGRPGPLTPDGARKLALGVLAEVAAGGDPAEDRDTSREALTLRQLAFRYVAEHAEPRKKPRSAAEDRRMLERDILPVLGSRRVLQISRAEVERLQLSMRERPTMGNRVVSLLSSLFHFAERRDLVPAFFNPSRGVQRFPERRRERFLSAQELARLGDALKALEDAYEAGRDPRRFSSELPAAVAALRLLVFTGARTSEILGLRWEHMDFEWGMLRIPDSKTGAKTIPLNAPALELLVARHGARGDSPWVIPGEVPGEHLVNLGKIWRRVRKRAGLEDVRLHDLRHSFASVGAAAGLSLPLIGALLGHRQASTTDRYAHLADDPIRSASELVGSRIAAALEGREEAPILEMEASKRRRGVRSGRRGGAKGGQSSSRGVSGADPKSPETGRS